MKCSSTLHDFINKNNYDYNYLHNKILPFILNIQEKSFVAHCVRSLKRGLQKLRDKWKNCLSFYLSIFPRDLFPMNTVS